MSQVFGADSVGSATPPLTNVAVESALLTGNFLNPPFGNAKAVVSAFVNFTGPTGITAATIRIRRNPSGENVVVGAPAAVVAAAGNNYSVSLQVSDAIPDGRPVQYQVTLQLGGATANGSVNFANISTLLISG